MVTDVLRYSSAPVVFILAFFEKSVFAYRHRRKHPGMLGLRYNKSCALIWLLKPFQGALFRNCRFVLGKIVFYTFERLYKHNFQKSVIMLI
jgi:hypothetical protein